MAKLSKKQLASMSKEEKLNYLEIVREKKKRDKLQKPPYQPNEGQVLVHESKALERYCFFGNGSGKTTLLANEIHWAATGFNNITNEYTKVPCTIICVVDDTDKIDMRIIPELRAWYEIPDKWLSKDGKPHTSTIKYPNGSTIKFLSHGIDPMKAEGIELDFLAFDEPPPQYLYNALTRGMRKKGGVKKTILVGTPIAEAWLLNEVYKPWEKGELPYVECFTGSSAMNKDNIDWERQEKWLARLSPEERSSRQDGKFFNLSGLALAGSFDRARHIVKPFDWPRNWPCVVAIDPAQSKPHVACLLGVNNQDKLYYIKEFSLRAPAREFARRLKDWYKEYPVMDIICDSLGNSGMSGGEGLASFIDVLNDEGVRARATRYEDKDDERWIEAIQQALFIDEGKEPQLRIFEGNFGLIHDIENVSWQKIKGNVGYKPKLDISKKDFLATLKYALAVRPRFSNTRKARPISTIQGSSASLNWRNRGIY